MPLETIENEWLLDALAKTDCPMSCPHGRPWWRYSMKEIERRFIAFELRSCRLMAGKERHGEKSKSSYFPFY